MSAGFHPAPPAVFRWLLRRLLPTEAAEFISGDLDEEYRRYAAGTGGSRAGRLRAGVWYRWQAVRTLLPFWMESRAARGVSDSRSGSSAASGGTPSLSPRPPGAPIMFELWRDARFTVRNLYRAPGYAITVLVTLAVGIGATTAMFSAVHEVMLRPLPYAAPDELVMLWDDNAEREWRQVEASPANVLDWRERVDAFEDVGMIASWTTDVALETGDGAFALAAGSVSGNLFAVLGIPALHGRTFTFDETWADAGPLVLLGHAVWARHFSADPSIVGESVMLDGTAYEVIGVMPPEFRDGVADADLWRTYMWDPAIRESVWFRQAHVSRAIARLRPGVSVDEGRSELAAVGAQLREEFPELNRGMEPGLGPLQTFLVGDRRAPMLLLLGAVTLLQLIACANVANLLLVRSHERRAEMAVRAALGAGRARLARLVVNEGVLLASGGAIAGVLVAAAAMQWLEAIRPPELPQLVFRADPAILGFTVALAAGSALLFSLLPMARTARTGFTSRLSSGSPTGTRGAASLRAAGSLVALEIALALVLLVGAGLLTRSLTSLSRVDTDFDGDSILTFELTPPAGLYPRGADREALAYRLIEELQGLPGVRAVGATRGLPFTGYGWSSDFTVEGWGPEEFGLEIRHRAVTSGYFRALSVPLVEGEIFDDARAPDEAVSVVVNEAFVERYFPDGSPVGRRIAFDRRPGENSYWYPIVAVVGNEPMLHGSVPEPEVISHFAGDTPNTMRLAIAADVPPETLVGAARDALARVDRRIPFVAPRTMREVAADALARERFLMTLLSAFGAAALALSAVGVYGVAAQAARGRTREIGIRKALGATGTQITRQLLARAAAFVGAGTLLGLAGVAASGRLIAGMLYAIQPTDPLTWAGAALLLGAVGLVATYLPARRAARANPAAVLHAE